MRSERKRIVQTLLDADEAAAKAAASGQRLLGGGIVPAGEMASLVRTYILAKYRLDVGECESDGLQEFAEASLAKALAVDPDLARKANAASTCDGASTTDMKQALLLVALQRDFGVVLDGIELAYAETVGDLAALLEKAAICSRDEGRLS